MEREILGDLEGIKTPINGSEDIAGKILDTVLE